MLYIGIHFSTVYLYICTISLLFLLWGLKYELYLAHYSFPLLASLSPRHLILHALLLHHPITLNSLHFLIPSLSTCLPPLNSFYSLPFLQKQLHHLDSLSISTQPPFTSLFLPFSLLATISFHIPNFFSFNFASISFITQLIFTYPFFLPSLSLSLTLYPSLCLSPHS